MVGFNKNIEVFIRNCLVVRSRFLRGKVYRKVSWIWSYRVVLSIGVVRGSGCRGVRVILLGFFVVLCFVFSFVFF